MFKISFRKYKTKADKFRLDKYIQEILLDGRTFLTLIKNHLV